MGFANSVLKGLLGTLFIIRDTDVTPWPALSAIVSVVRATQLMSFCFSGVFTSWLWAGGLHEFSTSMRADLAALGASMTTEAVVLGAVLAWVVLLLSLIVYASYSFMHESFPALSPLGALRVMGNASREVLLIPIVTVLAKFGRCGDARTPALVARSLCMWVLLVTFVGFCSLLSLTCFDNSLPSTSHLARAHGQLDFIRTLTQTVLVLCISVYASGIRTKVLVGILLSGSSLEFSAAIFFSPYSEARWNTWTAALAGSFWWMNCLLAVSELTDGLSAAVAVCMAVFRGALTGAYFSHVRLSATARALVDEVLTVYCVEIKARSMIRDALSLAHFATTMGSALEHTAAFRRAVPPDVIVAAKAAYAAGVARFPSSAILHVFASRFCRALGNSHDQLNYLVKAELLHPLLDSLFDIDDARKSYDDGTRRSRLNAMQRISVAQRLVDVKLGMQRVTTNHRSYWTELAQPAPSLSRLSDLVGRISAEEDKIGALFSHLLLLDSRSTAALGLYAAFVEHIPTRCERRCYGARCCDRSWGVRLAPSRRTAGCSSPCPGAPSTWTSTRLQQLQ